MKPSYVKFHEEQLSELETVSEKLDYVRNALHDVGVMVAWTREQNSEEQYLKELEIQIYGEYKLEQLNEQVKDIIDYLHKNNIKLNIGELLILVDELKMNPILRR
jgi:cob(I)alamin adenosyltransferase